MQAASGGDQRHCEHHRLAAGHGRRHGDLSTWSRSGILGSRRKSPSPTRARSAITNWVLQFNFAATITSIWNATIASHSGTQYVIDNAGYNSSIAPGQSVTFGFLGSPGGVPASPTSYLLNGKPIAGAVPPLGPLEATVTFADVDDWGTGFTGNITITNTGTTAIIGWTLTFDFAVSISSIWNASIVSQNGNHVHGSRTPGTTRSSCPGKA